MPPSSLDMTPMRHKLVELVFVLLVLSLAACRGASRESPASPPSKDAGAQAPQTARSIDEIRTWPLGVAKQLVLYDLGTGYLSAPEAIHVDDTWVYWSQGTRLFRAPKDGSGAPELRETASLAAFQSPAGSRSCSVSTP